MTAHCKVTSSGDMTTVTVTVVRDLRKYDMNECRRNSDVLRELRKAGVPVIGAISILCVEFGTLTMRLEDNLDDELYVYEWTGHTADMLGPMPTITSEFPMKAALKAAQEVREAERKRGIFRDPDGRIVSGTSNNDEEL